MSHTPMRVVPVDVDVTASADGTVSITCSPESADVLKDTKYALISFTLKTAGYRFPATDAITLDNSSGGDNFPYPSWTLSDTQAALYDNNKSKKAFAYTVTVVNATTGQVSSVDPVINNGGGGTGMEGC